MAEPTAQSATPEQLADELGFAEEKLANLRFLISNGGKDDLSEEFRGRLDEVLRSKPDQSPGWFTESKARWERQQDLLIHIQSEVSRLSYLQPMTPAGARTRSIRRRLRVATTAASHLAMAVDAVRYGDYDFADKLLDRAREDLNAYRPRKGKRQS